jgi:glycine dehydrogenase subunit 2
MVGFIAVEIPSDARGNIDVAALSAACNDQVAGLMITNPNTLGLFEEHVDDWCTPVAAPSMVMR